MRGSTAALGAAVVSLLAAGFASAWSDPATDRPGPWPADPYPASERLEAARDFAEQSSGTVAFAVVDDAAGVRGLEQDRQYSSASASKALLLAGELQRLRSEDEPLDEGTRSTLEAMITYSDNDAASSIYSLVGDGGMEQVARDAGMRSFEVTPGYWGGAQVTAADLARFFKHLDRTVPARHLTYAESVLAGITESQRWGIPDGAGPGWRIYFKGGWRPAGTTENSGSVTHQAALLRHRSGREIGLAVLTDLSPGTTSYGVIEGITERLLSESPAPLRWPAN